MAVLPKPSVTEIWGEGPFFTGRCWFVSWPLSPSQIISVNKSLMAPDFWNSIRLLVPELNSKQSTSWVPKDLASPDSIFEHAILTIANSMLYPTELSTCSISSEINLNGLYCSFESNQHEILGAIIKFTVNIIWECINRLFDEIPFAVDYLLQKNYMSLIEPIHICCDHPLTKALLIEASSREISFLLVDYRSRTYQFGEGDQGRIFSSSSNDLDSFIGAEFANNKAASHRILLGLGVKVPRQISFSTQTKDSRMIQLANKVGFPCVVKPPDTERGQGITSDIHSLHELKEAVDIAKRCTNKKYLLLQEQIPGSDYRLNVTGGNLKFVVKRTAPTIIGNGVDTIKVLIEKLNISRRSHKMSDGLSSEINIDDSEVLNCISSAGLNIGSVVEINRIIPLRRNSNVSTGGLREEISPANVHPRIVNQCISIAKTMRLDCCGIDYITTDISLDPLHHPGAFIEVNYMPQHQPHRAKDLIDNLFPKSLSPEIPCTLLVANWGEKPSHMAVQKLIHLINENPNATFACPLPLHAALSSLLIENVHSHFNFFSHPTELIKDKSISNLICLLTPDLLIKKGWIIPRKRLRIVNFVKPTTSSVSKALFRYLDGLALSR